MNVLGALLAPFGPRVVIPIAVSLFTVPSAHPQVLPEDLEPVKGLAFDGTELIEDSCQIVAANEGEPAGLRDVPGMHVLGRGPENPLVLTSTEDLKINGVICWRSAALFAPDDYLVPERLGYPFYVKTESEDQTKDRTLALEKSAGFFRVRLLAGPAFTDSEKEQTIRVLRHFEESATNGALAREAPKDQPVGLQSQEIGEFEKAIAPYVAMARSSYPDAKRRFELGLPPEQIFFITTRLRDARGRFEQVFVRVQRIGGRRVTGVIASEIQTVEGYTTGQTFSFEESELLDWSIAKSDGSEEGNFVGKFLDTYQR